MINLQDDHVLPVLLWSLDLLVPLVFQEDPVGREVRVVPLLPVKITLVLKTETQNGIFKRKWFNYLLMFNWDINTKYRK